MCVSVSVCVHICIYNYKVYVHYVDVHSSYHVYRCTCNSSCCDMHVYVYVHVYVFMFVQVCMCNDLVVNMWARIAV